MVPFTIFHRLSSLGSGGGVNAGTIPPDLDPEQMRIRSALCLLHLYTFQYTIGRDNGHGIERRYEVLEFLQTSRNQPNAMNQRTSQGQEGDRRSRKERSIRFRNYRQLRSTQSGDTA